MPGRPQDGADGNRINRWLLQTDHKFYADEATATLVEIRYYMQALSMLNAPAVIDFESLATWEWLTEGPIRPDTYLDPIQLIPIDFDEVVSDPRLITSGHLVPLDRDGRHEPHNTFLTLAVSNTMQGNRTLDELLTLMWRTVAAHRQQGWRPPLSS